MPGFDGTGPMGMGPRTGGGRGFCASGIGATYGYGAGRGGMPRGCGYGRAWGGGRGRGGYVQAGPIRGGAPFAASYSPEQEISFLQSQSAALEQEIQRIKSRIDALGNRNEEK